jgi:Rrf2 family protein
MLALMELARGDGGHPLQSKDIASKAAIPKPFLDQLLLDLKRSGLVRSVRGPGGGYVLARAPSSVTLRDAIHAVEGGALTTSCGIKSADGASCRRSTSCVLMEVWREIDRSTDKVLTGVTLASLSERQRKLDGQEMYYI